jgi:hypothetical protein
MELPGCIFIFDSYNIDDGYSRLKSIATQPARPLNY